MKVNFTVKKNKNRIPLPLPASFRDGEVGESRVDSFWDKNPEWREWANTPREVVVEYLGDLSKDSHYKLNDVVIANYRAG